MLDGEELVLVARKDLAKEHDLLIARLHQLRRLLGYPALMTGKRKRNAHTSE